MDFLKNAKRKDNPQKKCNLLSRYFLCYLNDTFSTGAKRQLLKEDILKISDDDASLHVSDKLQGYWDEECKKLSHNGKPSFFRAVIKMSLRKVIFITIVLQIMSLISIGQTLLLQQLLQSITNTEEQRIPNEEYYWAAGVCGLMLLFWLTFHQASLFCERLGANLASASMALVFKKTLKMSNGVLSLISTGHVVTIMSTDSQKIQEMFLLLYYIVIGPVQTVLATFILWRNLGPSCLVGMGLMLLFIPFQSLAGKLFAHVRMKTVAYTDKRVNTMSEIISSIQVTKMFSWEDSFVKTIAQLRVRESSKTLKSATMRAINYSMLSSSPYVIALAIFSTFYFHGTENLSMPVVMLTMSIFFTIRFEVVAFFPLALQKLFEGKVGCERIQAYLLSTEHKKENIGNEKQRDSRDNYVSFENVTATWTEENLCPVIQSLSFKANEENNLVMIIGPVGSGKSSVLMAVMNELIVQKGNIDLNGSIAYCAQQPWIFSGTVRQNILFGKPFNKSWYNKCIKACGLIRDLQEFPKRDMTLVGEKGISLSGGQKSRIGLARAVYHDADIYLLDDPLSAIDSKVGKEIFENCIQSTLKDKIVLLVTHQIQYLEHATYIVDLHMDTPPLETSLHDLPQKSVNLISILNTNSEKKSLDNDSPIEEEDVNVDSFHQKDSDMIHRLSESSFDVDSRLRKSKRGSSRMSTRSCHSTYEQAIEEGGGEDENKASGAIALSTYYKYFIRGVGWAITLYLLFVTISGQFLLTFTDYWLAGWAQGEEERDKNRTISFSFFFDQNPDMNLYIFAALVAASAILNIVRTVSFYTAMVYCSRNLHNAMFEAVLHAPMYFFDTNPLGKILNRFSRDVHFMDDEIPWVFNEVGQLGILALTVIVLNCVSLPYLVIIFVPMAFIFLYFANYYMKSSREIRRLEGASRSPFYTHLSATLNGITTIRSFDKEQKVLEEFHACNDYQIGAWLMYIYSSRWFSLRIDLYAIIFATCALFAPLVLARYVDMNVELVGLSLTYVVQLTGMLQWVVRQVAEMDNLMTSVERCVEYSELDQEPDNGESKDLPKGWPENGLIKAEEASFAYHITLPFVLKKLNFCVNPKEKVGIVGRTGAGKSSLINMLFRMGNTTGTIRIDGYAISDLSLADLRKTISVIPQDPILFSGPLRNNLDPFSEYLDADVWEALEQVQMKDTVMDLKGKLHMEIMESGSNLSVGERQLLCLARAILRRNKILMIDEATANVDYETDTLIQRTIREKFRDCTVLTIAHRLTTIMDSDRVMVLSEGKIVEFAEPFELLQSPGGHFRSLVDKTGYNEASRLELLAEEAHQLRTKLQVTKN